MIDPVELARQLLVIPSPTRHEQAVCAWMAEYLLGLGYTVVRQPVSDGRENVYAHRTAPVVVLSTHLDTVPPDVPFREDAMTLHGRGSCDAKGVAAAMVAAAERLHDAGEDRVALLFVVGEEDGSDGARAAAALEPKGRYLVNGEPTENQLVVAQKGALRVTLRASGRASHSGYPELGDSAINHLLDALERIRRIALPVDPLLGPATLNIGLVEGGSAPNVLAPSASAALLIRLVGPGAPVRAAIVAAAGADVEVEFPLEIPAHRAPSLPGWPETVVAYASDLPFFAAWGIGYQLGPGSIHVAHTDGEHLRKKDLHAGVDRYEHLVRTLLAGLSPA
jgi:acetylornithine deacetylase